MDDFSEVSSTDKNTKQKIANRVLLHDVGSFFSEGMLDALSEDVFVVSAKPSVSPCKGCFSCWIKTPGRCIIEDNAQKLPELISSCNELIIVSRLVYGGFSPDIKAYVDRLIPCLLPFFKKKKNMLYHPYRFKNKLKITYLFYTNDKPEQFSLEGQNNRPLKEFAEEAQKKFEQKEASKKRDMIINVLRADPVASPEKIDEIEIAEKLAKAVSDNFSAGQYECRYIGDIVKLPGVSI